MVCLVSGRLALRAQYFEVYAWFVLWICLRHPGYPLSMELPGFVLILSRPLHAYPATASTVFLVPESKGWLADSENLTRPKLRESHLGLASSTCDSVPVQTDFLHSRIRFGKTPAVSSARQKSCKFGCKMLYGKLLPLVNLQPKSAY